MPRRQPLPRLWLMTDERQQDALWAALARLPRGSGIVFRHYLLEPRERRALFEKVARAARRRGLVLIVAGRQRLDGRRRSHGAHNQRSSGLRTASAHDLRQLREAERAGGDLVFLSPIFATRSHPGARALGRARFGLIAGRARVPVIALGGVNRARARGLGALGAYGWAAIDGWTAPGAESD